MARELMPCGTMAAYVRHCRRAEKPCAECVEAARLYRLERRGGYTELPPLRPCGTLAAYTRHRRRGEEPCERCRAAWAAYYRDLRAARRAGGL